MSTFLKYIFPAANTQDVCLIQDATGPVNLVLNGNLANPTYTGTYTSISFIAQGYSRQVSFTSTNDLSGAIFTIGGTQNGVFVIEDVTGPNADTVYSVNVYDIISFVSVDTPITGIKVGTGYNGFFPLLLPNINTPTFLNYNFSVGSNLNTNVIGTTIYGTLEDLTTIGRSFIDIINNNVSTLYEIKAFGNEAAYIYQFPSSLYLFSTILVQLTGTTSTLGNSTTLIFRQLLQS